MEGGDPRSSNAPFRADTVTVDRPTHWMSAGASDVYWRQERAAADFGHAHRLVPGSRMSLPVTPGERGVRPKHRPGMVWLQKTRPWLTIDTPLATDGAAMHPKREPASPLASTSIVTSLNRHLLKGRSLFELAPYPTLAHNPLHSAEPFIKQSYKYMNHNSESFLNFSRVDGIFLK